MIYVLSGGAPTPAGISMFTMWNIYTHMKCEVTPRYGYGALWLIMDEVFITLWVGHFPLNVWSINSLNGWSSYGKVNSCFVWKKCWSSGEYPFRLSHNHRFWSLWIPQLSTPRKPWWPCVSKGIQLLCGWSHEALQTYIQSGSGVNEPSNLQNIGSIRQNENFSQWISFGRECMPIQWLFCHLCITLQGGGQSIFLIRKAQEFSAQVHLTHQIAVLFY